MKQQIPMPAIIAAIVAILAIVGFLGFSMMKGGDSKVANAPTGPTADQKSRYESMHNQAGASPYGGHSSSSMPGYPGSGGAGSGGR